MPPRDQMMNNVAACGSKFYIFAGSMQNAQQQYISTDDLWAFDPAGNSGVGSFTQLANPPLYYWGGPLPMYQSTMVCDSDANRLLVQTGDKVFVYSITNNTWIEMTPPNMPTIFNTMGVYAPTVKRFLSQGGIYYPSQVNTNLTYSISVSYATDEASPSSQVSTTTAPTTPAATLPPALASTLKALDLGVTGEDKVGQNNQTTPNGKPDFHLSVSGLRGTPNKVTITNGTGGIWETPFNGTNWIIATLYDGKGNGDFWFEQFASNKFHVKVRYADGTTDEADASKQAASTAVTAAVAPP